MKLNYSITTLLPLLTLVACSGSDKPAAPGAPGGSSGETLSAQFIDAPVKGLQFKTSKGVSGKTGDQGKFSCLKGDTVSFSLNQFDLGYSACGDKIFVQDLASNTANYTWDQAAAILQTFAVSNAGVLDFSAVDVTKIDLANVSYNATPSLLNLSAAFASSSLAYAAVEVSKVPTVTNTATAASNANKAIADYAELDISLLAALESIKTKPLPLKATLTSGYFEDGKQECWKYFKLIAEVNKSSGVNSQGAQKDLYKVKVNTFIGYDDDSILVNNECPLNDIKCFTAEDSDLPKAKTITGNKTNMTSSTQVYDEQYKGDVLETLSLELETPVINSKIQLSGKFNAVAILLTGTEKGKTFSCNYSLTADE